MRGRFVTLEGIDGAGKSSFLGCIERLLRAQGHEVVVTREPGGTQAGEALRTLLLHSPVESMSEALLMFAARREHLHNLILPAIEAGRWVLCDRFTDATFAYQGYGRGVDLGFLATLERWVQEGLQPDLTVLFDLPVAMARARTARARDPDRFESEQDAFFERVRSGYLARAAADPARFRIVDATQEMGAIEAELARLRLPAA
jgi:dTMP kinase